MRESSNPQPESQAKPAEDRPTALPGDTMSQGPETLFAAGVLATALGCSKRAVLMQLQPIAPSGSRTVRGQESKAWAYSSLPALMRVRLENRAVTEGFRSAEALLRAQEVGAAPALESFPKTVCAEVQHRDLISSLSDYVRGEVSKETREWVWAEVCRHYRDILAVTPKEERAGLKSSLIAVLLRHAPGLIAPGARRPERSLRRTLERKLAAFSEGGRDALRDGRETRSGNFRPVLCDKCRGKAIELGIKMGGNESGAWRALKQSGAMCEACQFRHPMDLRRAKSQVPKSIREAITPQVEAALPWAKSDAAGRMAGPSIPRDWSDSFPAKVFVADDVTWNHLVFDLDQNGTPRFFRPECLVFCDELTGYVITFLLIKGHYNSRHIRLGMLDAVDKAGGLPHEGFRFENGIWRSRLTRDELVPKAADIAFNETEDGFKTLGCLVAVKHTLPRSPRSKTIEGELRILQEKMRVEPGFVGFNEREEKSDAVKDLQRRVLAGREDPRNHFWSFEDCRDAVSRICEEFNAEPQNGARNDGLSPLENWREGLDRRPLRGLPPEARWIFATSRELRQVTPKGFQLGGKHDRWTFADGQISSLLGNSVWVYHHLDRPGLATVCDYKRTKWFSVRGIRLPATTATPEQIKSASGQIRDFNRVSRVLASNIKHPVVSHITRDNESTERQKAFGAHMEAAKAAESEASNQKERKAARRRAEGMALMRSAEMALAQENGV